MDKKCMVDREMMIFAFRYALGRMTYAPSTVVDNIKANIDKISTGDIQLYIKEIKEFKQYGMEMDKKHWLNFVDYLQKELFKREGKFPDVLYKIKEGDIFWVFDGCFGDGYKIISISKDFSITLDNTHHPEECVPAESNYDLKEIFKDYRYEVDDASKINEGIQYGIEFYKEAYRKFAIEVF